MEPDSPGELTMPRESYRFYYDFLDSAGDLQSMPVWARSRSGAETSARRSVKYYERFLGVTERPDCVRRADVPERYAARLIPAGEALPTEVLT